MKTFWKGSQYRDFRWVQAKRLEFEEKTGVKWDGYPTAGGVNFTPVLSGRIQPDPQYADRILKVLRDLDWRGRTFGISFLQLQKLIGGIPLADLLPSVKYLSHVTRKVILNVNQAGHPAALREKTDF